MALVPLHRRRIAESRPDDASAEIEARRTPEIILPLVGPLGAGVSKTGQALRRLLVEKYRYDVQYHDVSELIDQRLQELGRPRADASDKARRIEELQAGGNFLREEFGADHLARLVVRGIGIDRGASPNGYRPESLEGPDPVPLPRRTAHIIDSLKNPAELQLLELVYGEIVWLLGVFAAPAVREARLDGDGFTYCDTLMTRDDHEPEDYGQQVQKLFHRADFFVRNDEQEFDNVKEQLDRFLRVIMNQGVNSPTPEETGMFTATAAAANSACLSRQVGAAIYSDKGGLVGVGWNDVPRFGGGQYDPSDEAKDLRCYRWHEHHGPRCHNDAEKAELVQHLYTLLRQEDEVLGSEGTRDKVEGLLSRSRLHDLLEFSRSIHAEMSAILAAARAGRSGLEGATLYVTTFPCHNCARHIVAAGVRRVVFVEPYPKSQALRFHSDSIEVEPRNEGEKVAFRQFCGFAPKNMIDLFGHTLPRKQGGVPITTQPAEASPVYKPMLDSFTAYERRIIESLEEPQPQEPTEGGVA